MDSPFQYIPPEERSQFTPKDLDNMAFQQGVQDARNNSINVDIPDWVPMIGGTHMGFQKFWKNDPDYMSAPRSDNPFTERTSTMKQKGYASVARENADDAAMYEAQFSHMVPDIVSKGADMAWGAMTGGRVGTTDWEQAKSSTDRLVDVANHFAGQTNTSTPQGQAAVARTTGMLGKPIWTAWMMQKAQENPEGWQAAAAPIFGKVDDFYNQAVMKDSLVNLAIASPLGAPLGLGKVSPFWRMTGASAVLAAPDYLYGKFPELAKWTGRSPAFQQEMAIRMSLGDNVANQMADSQYKGYWQDAQGNIQSFSGFDLDPSDWGNFLHLFPDYMDYINQHRIDPRMLMSEDTKFGYIMNRASTGTAGSELFNTPMFLSLNADHKAAAFDNWAENRYITSQDATNIAMRSRLSKASMFSRALATDKTGVFAHGIQNFLRSANAETLATYIGNHAGTTPGVSAPEDQEALLEAFGDGLLMNFRENPGNISPVLQDMLKLSQVQSFLSSKNPDAAPMAAQKIKTAFGEALRDPAVVNNMSATDRQDVLALLAQVYGSGNGHALLGQEGEELGNAVVQNLRGDAMGAFIRHPEIGPSLASAFFHSHDMPQMAGLAQNPWIFWSAIGAVLLGGGYLVGSALDDDEGDEERERYEKALRHRMYE